MEYDELGRPPSHTPIEEVSPAGVVSRIRGHRPLSPRTADRQFGALHVGLKMRPVRHAADATDGEHALPEHHPRPGSSHARRCRHSDDGVACADADDRPLSVRRHLHQPYLH